MFWKRSSDLVRMGYRHSRAKRSRKMACASYSSFKKVNLQVSLQKNTAQDSGLKVMINTEQLILVGCADLEGAAASCDDARSDAKKQPQARRSHVSHERKGEER